MCFNLNVYVPIKICFIKSINKAQEQMKKVVKIDYTDPCFTHGQYHVTIDYNLWCYFLLCTLRKKTYVYVPNQKYNIINK